MSNLTPRLIHLEPGIYKLRIPIPNPHSSGQRGYCWEGRDWWETGTTFIVLERTETIGDQKPYTYYSIHKRNSRHTQIRSYETERWNAMAKHLEPLATTSNRRKTDYVA